MKILQIILTTHGGMIHYTSQLSNALSKNNKVFVIVPIGTETKLFDNSINLIQLHTGNILRNFIINSIIITRMSIFLKTIKRINPDIIHLQSYHPWMCLFLPFLKKYKIVTTIHDVNFHKGSRIVDQQIARYIHVKYSDALIVHGDNAKIILEKKAPGKKIYVIPHGDYTFFTKLTRNNCIEESGNILFFGQIAEYKGLQYLIRAEPKIARLIPDTKIVIAGSGTFAEYDYVKESPHFELHNNYIQNEDVGSFFQRASIVVLPYIECTQTGIIPIAYAFKKPVVVTDVGSIPEIVEDGLTGFIVPPRDSDALADAVIKLLKDERLRKQMGGNAYMKMKKELSWNAIAEKTIEVYKTILNSKENK
jgi:starch synthase